MHIFPFLQPAPRTESEALPTLRDLRWDFERDVPIYKNGVAEMVEREAAVRVWAWNALHTARWQYLLFTPEYGCDVTNLIGQAWSDDLKRAEVRVYLEECLLASPYITAVTALQTAFQEDRFTARFQIESVYGVIEMEGTLCTNTEQWRR